MCENVIFDSFDLFIEMDVWECGWYVRVIFPFIGHKDVIVSV